MTKDELRETLHREMLFYYFAQQNPMLEIRKNESLMSAVWRKMQPYAACGFRVQLPNPTSKCSATVPLQDCSNTTLKKEQRKSHNYETSMKESLHITQPMSNPVFDWNRRDPLFETVAHDVVKW